MHQPTNRARCTRSCVSSLGGRSSLSEPITDRPRFRLPPGELYTKTCQGRDAGIFFKKPGARQLPGETRASQTSLSLLKASASAGSVKSLSVSSATSSSNWSSNSWGSDSSAFLLCVPLQTLSPWEDDVQSELAAYFNLCGVTDSHMVRTVLGAFISPHRRRLIP